jgi:hypothetical protein
MHRVFTKLKVDIANFINYKSPGINQIPSQLFQAVGEILRSEIHKLVKSIWGKEELPQRRNEYIIAPI